MALDFKHFKKVDADKRYTTFQHPEGHIIKIAHAAIDKSTHDDIRKLPLAKLDKGGVVPPPKPQGQPQAEQAPQTQTTGQQISSGFSNATGTNSLKKAFGMADGGEAGVDEPVVKDDLSKLAKEDAKSASDAPVATQASPMADMAPPPPVGGSGNFPLSAPAPNPIAQMQDPTGLQGYKQGVGEQVAGTQQTATAEGQLGQQQAGINTAGANAIQETLENTQQNIARVNAERQRVATDIENGHIDPNQWFSSRSTVGKIATVLGMIVGGVGQGQGLKFIEQQINNDIDSQKSDLGRKQNLLSHLNEQFNNLNQSALMAKSLIMDHTAAQLQAQANLMTDPVKKAQSLAAVGQIHQASSQQIAQLGMMQAVLKGQGTGQINPGTAARFLIQNPSEREKAEHELGIAEKTATAHKAVDQIVDQVSQQQTTGNRLMNPVQSAQIIKGLRAQLVPLIMESSPSKRLTHESIQAEIDPLIPGFLSNKTTTQNLRSQLHNLVDTHADSTPTLESYGIQVPKYHNSKKNPNTLKR